MVRRAEAMPDTRVFPLTGARPRHPDVERWLVSLSPDIQRIARRWFDEIRACGADVQELLHDGHPTACVGGLAFAYVNAFRAHVNVGFFLGNQLDDPRGLLEGTGRFMRHVKVRPGEPAREDALGALIRAAYEDMKARQPE